MRCNRCSAELPPGFPGAKVRCACGAHTTLASAPSHARSAHHAPGPYRASGARVEAAREEPCPYCGHAFPPLATVCPSCDVPLEQARCSRCFAVQRPGSVACERCCTPVARAKRVGSAEACPRCATPLASASHPETDARIQECTRCGGLFVPRDALVEIVRRAEESGAFLPERPREGASPDKVEYMPCPLCTTTMSRANFGAVSGIIVDECRAHGTWFDAGELTRAVAFTSAGRLATGPARARREGMVEETRAAAERREPDFRAEHVPGVLDGWSFVRDLVLGRSRWRR